MERRIRELAQISLRTADTVMVESKDEMNLEERSVLDAQIGDLEAILLDDARLDPRMSNGAAADSSLDDMLFIRMSGLAPPVSRGARAEAESFDADAPLSFYEKGVEDVDDEAVPHTNKDGVDPADGVIAYFPRPANSLRLEPAAVTNLKEIIADLTLGSASGVDEHDPDELDAHGLDDERDAVDEYPTPYEEPIGNSADALYEETPAGLVTPYDDLADFSIGVASDVAPAGLENPFDPGYETGAFVARSTDREDHDPPRKTADVPAAQPIQATAPMPSDDLDADDLYPDSETLERHIEENAPGLWEYPPRGEHWDDPLETSAETAARQRRRRGVREHGWRANLRGARILVVNLLIGAAIIAALVLAIRTYQTSTATPGEAYAVAERNLRSGRYTSASAAFDDFAARYPDDPKASQAQFMAANALFSVPETPKETAQPAYAASLELFDKFLAKNQHHPKAPRAESLRAILFFRLGRFDEAVHLLQNPDRISADPEAKLPSLRTLARSYAALGRIEEAASTYLRAALIESNPSPDEDYLELAELYRSLADRQPGEDLRRRYDELMKRQWQFAARVPGLPPARERTIRRLLEGDSAAQDTAHPGQTKAETPLGHDENAGVAQPIETQSEPELPGDTHEKP